MYMNRTSSRVSVAMGCQKQGRLGETGSPLAALIHSYWEYVSVSDVAYCPPQNEERGEGEGSIK